MRCSRRRRAGLTLIEVIASLAILGTLLTGMLLAKAQLTRQSVAAQRQLEAAEVADRLLTRWVMLEEAVPCPDAGVLEGWRWTTRWLEEDGLAEVASRRVRLEVWPVQQDALTAMDPQAGVRDRPACLVDVVVALKVDETGVLP